MATILTCLFMLAVIYSVKFVFFIVTAPFRVLRRILFGRPAERDIYVYDVPEQEYDEFDWWQDNQGF